MPAAPKRHTGFLSRVKQALTGSESDASLAHRRSIDHALKELNQDLATGKISQDELDDRIAKLTRGTNGQAG